MTLLMMPLAQQWAQSMDHMLHVPLPLMEKVMRPVIVYLLLVALLRIFGKRELAQLNPFDLVVLLSLSNTVQNAIIGDDNSVTGGIVGAFALLAINWVVARLAFRSRGLTHLIEGRSTVLVRDGVVDQKAMDHESLAMEDLLSALHKQGFTNVRQVKRCELEPNGTFYVEAIEPTSTEQQHQEILARLDSLTETLAAMRGNAGASEGVTGR